MEQKMNELMTKVMNEKYFRSLVIRRDAINTDDRTVELSFSSEEPYERWFGWEILGHKKGEVDLSWINGGTAPFLDGHDSRRQIGVILKAWVDKETNKGRALVKFSKSAAADEVFQDIIDGIKQNVSVGYEVKSMKLISESEEQGNSYRVDGWTPLEASVVSIPADRTVGTQKSGETTTIKIKKGQEAKKMELTEQEKAELKAKEEARIAAAVKDASEREVHRVREIMALGNHKAGDFRELAIKAVEDKMPLDDFRKMILEKIADGKSVVNTKPDQSLGLGKQEIKRYSFMNLIRALASGDWSNAGFEKECSQAFEKRNKRTAKGIFIPSDMFAGGAFFNGDMVRTLVRDLNTGVGSAGGYLVAEELATASFIELLRNRAMVLNAGAIVLSDLDGDIDIPKMTGGATAYWLGQEGDDVTESQQSLGQVRMSPKTVGVLTDITRRMMIQSSISAEAFVRNDFMNAIALKIDAAAINGSGAAGEPRGILNTTGIGSVTLTTANTPIWSEIVGLETAVAVDNALIGNLSYMTNATIAGNMKVTDKASGAARFLLEDGRTNGYPVGMTNQVPAKHIIFGNFADLIVGYWSGLDVTVDKSTLSASGGTRIVAFQDVDVAVRNAESFADGYKS